MKIIYLILLMILFTNPVLSQWESIGPYGGYIRCLIKDNQGRIISGNAYGGIFRTSDAGQNWEQLFTGYRNEDVRSLAVNSNNHIFAGTDLRGLYLSTNDGLSWERLVNSVSTRTINDILIKSNGDIFIGTFNGVYRSTDNGNTFTSANNGITNTSIYSLGLSGDYIFAGTNGAGVFRSSDDGANWEAANSGINLNDGIVWDFASAEETENVGAAEIHALTQNELYRSLNSGASWVELSLPSGLYVDVLLKNNGDIYVVGDKILNSTDQGNSWNTYNSPTSALISSVVEIDPNSLMIGTQGPGNYVSTDNGFNWNLEVTGMPATAITNISTTAGVINVSTRHSGVFSSNDGGLNWFNLSLSIPNGWFYGLYQHPITNTFFALHQNGVYRSINGGADWNLTSAFGKTMVVNSLGNIFLGGGSFISKSTDDGVSYQSIQIGANVFYSLDIAVDLEDNIYVATANENGLQGQGVYKSSDLGISYFPYNVGLPNDITSVETVDRTGFPSVFDCIKEMLAADANGNFYSNNQDGSWNPFNIGFQQGGLVKDIAALNYTDGISISVITEREMFKINDESNCIFEEEENLPDDAFFLEMGRRFGLGDTTATNYVGTLGSGIFKRDVSTGVEKEEKTFPNTFRLEQNYPNPFNPTTTIQFSLPERSFVKLEVFNTLGEKVSTLVAEELNAGVYNYEWSAEDLPSGIYFYRLSTNKFFEMMKMILLK
ncbi:MAG: T9SS type A sorting domain-containing protein [bacterium]|nr:T9SS type A sorting domain-containing protein [bacterium]